MKISLDNNVLREGISLENRVTRLISDFEPTTLRNASFETTDTSDNGILVPNSKSVISRIKYHAEFTPSFYPEKFELPKAYYATAESVRDMLITNWNATYNFHEKMNFAGIFLSASFVS
ncbi:hypothetical protein L2E82_45279 [Cichorium intybus]|uniref:Uncharacterized protein n=1 Tax=Cichorium intybus TaxID=13427 RepID=A0ACB8ZRK7_CICIN|nr:hypothetical protein L2E82_45279 [Cichorium intybus]